MKHLHNRFAIVLMTLCLFSCMLSCELQEAELDITYLDLESNNLEILPVDAVSTDTIKVIEAICGNESDVILNIQGMKITYKRYFNSLMMMPCSPQFDTTVIGQLNSGMYQFLHIMIDKNHLLTENKILVDTLWLQVE